MTLDIIHEVLHGVSTTFVRVFSWGTFFLSFVEQHVAVITLGIAAFSALVRWWYDKREDARREELHRAEIRKLDEDTW